MYMRRLNFYLTSRAENKTTFSLYKRKIINPTPYQNGQNSCSLAHFSCLNNFSQKFFACLYQKQETLRTYCVDSSKFIFIYKNIVKMWPEILEMYIITNTSKMLSDV